MQIKKRTRATHPKVRTGCHTCKTRRVKCDELRPSCNKCTATGRKCEGYKSNHEWVVIVAPSPPLTDGFEDDRSRRHFDYFRTQAVYELSWFFDGDYWSRLVLQESHSSLAVRHAIIALACSHEDFKEATLTQTQAPQYAYAALHYSKAIKHLIRETSGAVQDSKLRALMCGLLFISIDTFRGNRDAALHHLDGCLKIVKETQAQLGMAPLANDRPETVVHLYRDIIPMYARLDLQASLGISRRRITSVRHESVYSFEPERLQFSTMIDAVHCLYFLANSLYDVAGGYVPLYKRTTAGPEVQIDRPLLERYFTNWDHACLQLIAASGGTHDRDKFAVLRMHQRAMLTLLASTSDDTEMLIDTYQWAFRDAVNFGVELTERSFEHTNDDSSSSSDSDSLRLENSARSTPNPTPLSPPSAPVATKQSRLVFVLDTGVVFSLYWTALKCRDGLVRRRAISLLEGSGRENAFIGPIQAAMAKRVVEIEEGQTYEQDPPLERVKRAKDIPRHARVHNVNSDIMQERRMARMVVSRRSEDSEETYETLEWVSW